MLITCYKCRAANCYITGDKKATCRSCGNVFEFTYDRVADTDTLKASLTAATNGNKQYLNDLAARFFFAAHKPDWRKHSIYYNMYIFLQYGDVFKFNGVPVVTLEAKKLKAILQGEIKMHTRPTKTDYRGVVFLHQAGGSIKAAAVLNICPLVQGATLTSYAAEVAAGQRIGAILDGPEAAHSDFTPGLYAYVLEDVRRLTKAVKHPDAINGFSFFTGDYSEIKIKW